MDNKAKSKQYNKKERFEKKLREYNDEFGFEWVEEFTLNGA